MKKHIRFLRHNYSPFMLNSALFKVYFAVARDIFHAFSFSIVRGMASTTRLKSYSIELRNCHNNPVINSLQKSCSNHKTSTREWVSLENDTLGH